MQYILLTGSTGLLGRYLLRDLLARGQALAVVARRSPSASARVRLDTILRSWESSLGRLLPRPVVLEGDLADPNLGLDAAALDWVAGHCRTVVHNAANIRFHAESPDGEPWRSNVAGTRHVLDVCRSAGLRSLVHVSTAYVCGLRAGRVLENELDVGQTMGNDYECSKVTAERMVREAPFLDAPTILRPAIIVGDSQTGYTATFHGFYAGLQLGYTLAKASGFRQTFGVPFLDQLGLRGDERKNLVPVDWVSAVATRVIMDAKLHGITYHLTNPEGATVRDIDDAVAEAIARQAPPVPDSAAPLVRPPEHEQYFRENMSAYRAYFRDDPTFDRTHTQRIAGDLPCPRIDRSTMVRLAEAAIKANFGWPRPRDATPVFDVESFLDPVLITERPPRCEHELSVRVTGSGGGDWKFFVSGGQIVAAERGVAPCGVNRAHLNVHAFAELAAGRQSCLDALYAGRIVVESPCETLPLVPVWLQQLFPSPSPEHREASMTLAALPKIVPAPMNGAAG